MTRPLRSIESDLQTVRGCPGKIFSPACNFRLAATLLVAHLAPVIPRAESASPVRPERRFHFAVSRLRGRLGSAIVRRVKLPRVLFLLAAVSLLPACTVGRYTRFRSANLRGGTLAEWTARGPYYRVSSGYRITAVERISGPPYAHESRYPRGWKTTVTGPVIEHWPTGRPAWLDEEAKVEETSVVEMRVSDK